MLFYKLKIFRSAAEKNPPSLSNVLCPLKKVLSKKVELETYSLKINILEVSIKMGNLYE